MLDLQGPVLTDDERHLLLREPVGGIILFARNIVDAAQVAALTAEIRTLRPDLLLAVDQEGGRVQRLKQGFTLLPPMRCLGDLHVLQADAALRAARLLGRLMAAEVLAVGLDISFAPVLDVDYGQSAVIGDRAFASDPDRLIPLASAFITGMQQAGMAATGKHYPGHGHVSGDSHTCLPVDERPLAELQASCLQPFVALADHLQGIMPAHVIFSALDSQPAGFSSRWLQLLRQDLGFAGVIFSDDLTMAGAEMAGSFPQRAAAALQAGCDQVLVCNHREGAIEVLNWMENTGIDACAAILDLKAHSASGDWLQSSEATQARCLSGALLERNLQAAMQLLV